MVTAANGFVTMDISSQEINVEYYARDMKFEGGDLYPVECDLQPSYSFQITQKASQNRVYLIQWRGDYIIASNVICLIAYSHSSNVQSFAIVFSHQHDLHTLSNLFGIVLLVNNVFVEYYLDSIMRPYRGSDLHWASDDGLEQYQTFMKHILSMLCAHQQLEL